MREALAAHDEVLRVAVEAHGGWLFKHTGDGVCAAFAVAGEAVAAAVDAQRGLGLPVRMGVTTGEAELRGDDYFGPALNRAARVMAAGDGGQILVAAATAGLVSGVGLVDLGECRLRDLSGPEHLFQVREEGLQVEFPPLRTLDVTGRSLILTSNRRPEDWYPLFPNPVVAESILDRLINTAHTIHLDGRSYRPTRRPPQEPPTERTTPPRSIRKTPEPTAG